MWLSSRHILKKGNNWESLRVHQSNTKYFLRSVIAFVKKVGHNDSGVVLSISRIGPHNTPLLYIFKLGFIGVYTIYYFSFKI